MITTLNNVTLQINIDVKFKLASLTDKQTWRGKIIGLGGYDVAAQYSDIYAAHNNMEPQVVSKDPVTLTYLIIKCTDGQIRPFATDWILETTFDRTDNVTDMTIMVYNVSEVDKAKVLTTLRTLGYEVTEV